MLYYQFQSVESGHSVGIYSSQVKRLLDEIELGEVNIVVIHSLDRLVRNLRDLCHLLDFFEDNKVILVSISEKFHTSTSLGRLVLHIIGAFGQWEDDTIGERTVRGMKQSFREGNYAFAGAPFGYIKVQKKLVVNASQAKIVKRVFELVARNSYSVWSIAQYLKSSGLEGPWSEASIWRLITNPIYYGCVRWKDQVIENHSPVIISKELFNDAQDAMSIRKKQSQNLYLFKNRVYCADCECLCHQ